VDAPSASANGCETPGWRTLGNQDHPGDSETRISGNFAPRIEQSPHGYSAMPSSVLIRPMVVRPITGATGWDSGRANQILRRRARRSARRVPYRGRGGRHHAPPRLPFPRTSTIRAVLDMDASATRDESLRDRWAAPAWPIGRAIAEPLRFPPQPSKTIARTHLRFMERRLGRQNPHGLLVAYAMAGLIGSRTIRPGVAAIPTRSHGIVTRLPA